MEYLERSGNQLFRSLKRSAEKGQMHFNMAVKKFMFCDFCSCFKEREFTAVKRDAKY